MAHTSPIPSLEQPTVVIARPPMAYRSVRPAGWHYVFRQLISALPLMAIDACASFVSVGVVYLSGGTIFGWSFLTAGELLTGLALFSMAMMNSYPGNGQHPAGELKRQLIALAVVLACLGTFSFSASFPFWPSLVGLGLAWGLLLPTARSIGRATFHCFGWWNQPAIMIGSADDFEAWGKRLQRDPHAGLRLVGYFSDSREQWYENDVSGEGWLGQLDDIDEFISVNPIYWVIWTGSDDAGEPARARAAGIPHHLFPRRSVPEPNVWERTFFVDGEILLHQTDRLLLPQNRMVKRGMDLVLAVCFSAVAIPLIVCIALVQKLFSRGPVFYRSLRVGKNGQTIKMTKFRTMRNDADAYLEKYLLENPERQMEWSTLHKLTADPRITRLGALLRKSSLDELPQIFDVLRGTMSLVGPRPMLIEEKEKYGDHYQDFCRMLPGITGLWQVSGRNAVSYQHRLNLVSHYVRNWSPWLDLYLLAKTAKVVITGDGAL